MNLCPNHPPAFANLKIGDHFYQTPIVGKYRRTQPFFHWTIRTTGELMLFLFAFIVFGLQASGQIITTIAGTGTGGFSGDGGDATSARIGLTHYITIDKFGNYYFNDFNGCRIRKVNATGVISTVAGNGSIGFGGDGGAATVAILKYPEGIVCDTAGNIFIADHQNFRIRKVDIASGNISTVAGNGGGGDSGDGGQATSAMFIPDDIHFDKNGNLYLTDGTHNKIRRISLSGIISTFAGTGTLGFSGDGGVATAANLSNPTSLTIDDTGNVYIVDGGLRVRRIDTFGFINTVIGNGIGVYSGDGIAATAAQLAPQCVTCFQNTIFVSDTNERIRKIDISGIIHTVAGIGTAGYGGDGSSATTARINRPFGIDIDACGNIYFVDVLNYRIRKITYPPILTTPTISLSGALAYPVGSTVTVTAAVGSAGSSYTIHWLNHGLEFTTTTVPSVTYTKPPGTDTITAHIVPTGWGCWDSTTSSQHVVTADATGLSGITQPWCMVYPNPATNTIFIAAAERVIDVEVENFLGQIVKSKSAGSKQTKIDVADLPRGIYVVKVNGIYVQKILKE